MIKRQPGFMRPGEEVQDDDDPGTEVVAHPSIDLPTDRPIVNQCAAHRKNGARCRKPSIRGATVCLAHGGGAPQVRRKAQTRLAMAADDLMKALLKIALSSEDENTRLRATLSALDRAGIGPKAELEVTHELKPFEQIMQDMVFSHVERGVPVEGEAPVAVDPAMERYSRAEAGDGSVIDVEVVEDEPDRAPADDAPPAPSGAMETMTWDEAYGGGPRRRRGTRMSRRG